jgi:hypothetical protein
MLVLLCAASLGSAQDLPPGQSVTYGPGTRVVRPMAG